MSVTVTTSSPAGLITRFASVLKTSPAETEQPAERSQFQHRHEDALAVLSATRGVIARGWVQKTWYVTEPPARPRPALQRFFPSRLDHQRVVGACLVGAVMHGGWQLSRRPEYAYPAIDALWNTLFDTDATGNVDPVGPMTPPLVRAARVRDLTTWNDRDHRTKQEVLRLVDLTTARVSSQRDAAVDA